MPSAFWIGSYTGAAGNGRGIYRADRSPDGTLAPPVLAAEADSPSYLAAAGSALYAVSEQDPGAVLAFAVDGAGLRPTGSAPVGAAPCHLAAGRGVVIVASYGTGEVSAHLLSVDGRLDGHTSTVAGHGSGPRPDRQEGPHAHAVAFAPDATVLSTDLGADLLRAHRVEAGTLRTVADIELPAGCGPRHLVIHPDGTVFVLTELARTVVALAPRAGHTDLRIIAETPATAAATGEDSSGAAIRLGAGGRFVYTSTRGADVITTHEVTGGALRPVADTPCGGHWPRDICVDGEWLHVANERSDTIATFRLDPATGVPELVGSQAVPSPVCVVAAR
ncbi:lactonase family protein [Pseudonocardia kunmingensis]|uniref:6-phosphogluconolactonase n=1 Tax=Pseudonocardia kunmingensis TaxID=630975 RepID=A0A543DNH2_9PSEU|nr:lactonase family protein [Pseudonocardia kunmingensis]TQM10870.1 6-phosphogluconolactonase [Pseudonocardia kunmingensis]